MGHRLREPLMTNHDRSAAHSSSPWPSEELKIVHRPEENLVPDVGVTVARAVAAATNTPLDELEPLGSAIDSERLDQLFGAYAGRTSGPLVVSFVYDDHPVTVTNEGEIRVYSREASPTGSD